MHLQRAQGQVMGKRMTVHNKFRALLDCNPTHGLVSLRYNNREVLRSQERGDGGLDLVETFFEPGCSFREIRESICLPSQ